MNAQVFFPCLSTCPGHVSSLQECEKRADAPELEKIDLNE